MVCLDADRVRCLEVKYCNSVPYLQSSVLEITHRQRALEKAFVVNDAPQELTAIKIDICSIAYCCVRTTSCRGHSFFLNDLSGPSTFFPSEFHWIAVKIYFRFG